MKQSIRQSVANIITIIGIATILLICVFQLQNIARLGEDIKAQNKIITAQTEIIKAQTYINQRYLRCILLLPPSAFKNTETRIEAIDKCAEDSRLPTGERLGGQ